MIGFKEIYACFPPAVLHSGTAMGVFPLSQHFEKIQDPHQMDLDLSCYVNGKARLRVVICFSIIFARRIFE